MKKGFIFYCFFNILFGFGNIVYSISIFSYYFLQNLKKENSLLLTKEIKIILSDSSFLFFNIPYSMHINLIIGIILLFFGFAILYFGNIIDKFDSEKEILDNKKILEKKLKYVNIILILFLIEISLMGFFYFIRSIFI